MDRLRALAIFTAVAAAAAAAAAWLTFAGMNEPLWQFALAVTNAAASFPPALP
jgi:hypothetical protein